MDFAVVGGGFCCTRRWILPSSVGWLPAAAADRRQPQKKGGGEICACFRTLTPLLAVDLPPPRKFLRWMASSRCRRQATAAKNKAVGKFVPASARPSPCLRWVFPLLWYFDPLAVISLSPRKSPGVAGALSLTPDGVSDPAAASGPRPSEAIPPVAKQGGGAKWGEGEARKAGERAVTTL